MRDKTHLNNSVKMTVLLLVLPIVPAFAGRVIYVDADAPADFNNIQAAIDDANDGDVVIVADGIYIGSGNRGIDFTGKAITVRSKNGADSCIIDCQEQGRGFYFHRGESSNSLLDGFTIMNGSAAHGGGIRCLSSSPTIANCAIRNNIAPLSPGFPGSFGDPGGGIASEMGSPLIINCIISDNTATSVGGGLYIFRGSPVIRNCTITGNTANRAGAIWCYSDCVVLVNNCILWGNTAADDSGVFLAKFFDCCPTVAISYSDVQGGRGEIDTDRCNLSNYVNWGPGNIDADPCFADPNNGDYHLKAQAGRWEPSENFKFQIADSKLANGMWVQDDVTSPCIDAGNPTDPVGHEPFPNGGRINMGAYGGTAEASKSYFGKPVCQTIVAGDINGDCKVDFKDFEFLASHWLQDNQ
jgi:parallel beta-helix repeat protein